ncbi:hypothetical protein FPY71_05840 [Aureimonas fodinaquatilis]|uniref:Uncharacterized protein n=1 Tax=Aureimonas fodinaquatilis TaxID=2565783 RepID=A0A5B0E0K1_9HYPH|nr:hypothetical protein [Aureimonas fodinaquatilis]KAA0972597.1 hypothetical protein FPY71_05840 [Aureimonas fodinaquatilis]
MMLTINDERCTQYSPRFPQLARRISSAQGRRLPFRLQLVAGRSSDREPMAMQAGYRMSLFDAAAPERN